MLFKCLYLHFCWREQVSFSLFTVFDLFLFSGSLSLSQWESGTPELGTCMHVNKLAGLVEDDGHIQWDLLCATSENKAELEISLEMTVSENLGQDQFLCFAHLSLLLPKTDAITLLCLLQPGCNQFSW